MKPSPFKITHEMAMRLSHAPAGRYRWRVPQVKYNIYLRAFAHADQLMDGSNRKKEKTIYHFVDLFEFIELSNSRFKISDKPPESISQIEQRCRYETELAIAVSKTNVKLAVEYYEKIKSCTFLPEMDTNLRDCKNA